MPALQTVDLSSEDGLLNILRNFGKGVSEGTMQNMENQDIRDLTSKITPDMAEEDVLREVLNSRLPLEKKKSVHEIISKTRQDALKNKEQKQKANKEEVQKQENIEYEKKLRKTGLPENLANLYANATTGGKTELIKYMRELAERGGEDYLKKLMAAGENVDQIAPSEVVPGQEPEQKGFMKPPAPGETPQPAPIVDLEPHSDKGLTAHELFQRQETRNKANEPALKEYREQQRSLESEWRSIKVLQDLNEQHEIDAQRWNINPFTGQILIPALSSPEAQLFEKTVNEFTKRAKTYYGSRVTNFDLENFMKTLPRLSNTKEGRALILRQMSLVEQAAEMEKKAVIDVFDKRGTRNVDWSDAERIAHEKTKPEIDRINKEYNDLNHLIKSENKDRIAYLKKKTPGDHILMEKPNGEFRAFPKKNKDALVRKGYKLL